MKRMIELLHMKRNPLDRLAIELLKTAMFLQLAVKYSDNFPAFILFYSAFAMSMVLGVIPALWGLRRRDGDHATET